MEINKNFLNFHDQIFASTEHQNLTFEFEVGLLETFLSYFSDVFVKYAKSGSTSYFQYKLIEKDKKKNNTQQEKKDILMYGN